MNNELYLGPSVDVAQSNQLGAAALNILRGAPELGHEKKINVADYGALLVAYIIFNDETVGLFVYDEDDGAYVHHQFMSSRVERCLLAHAAQIAEPFLEPHQAFNSDDSKIITDNDALSNVLNNLLLPTQVSPDLLLSSALTHLTASQRLHRKIRAIRKSNKPVYAAKSPLSKSLLITQLATDEHHERDKALIERSPDFIAWLNHKSDDELAHILEGCRLRDRPKNFKVLFETPERVTMDSLRVLDSFDELSTELLNAYVERFGVTKVQAKTQILHPSVRHFIDRGLIHKTKVDEILQDIHSNLHSSD